MNEDRKYWITSWVVTVMSLAAFSAIIVWWVADNRRLLNENRILIEEVRKELQYLKAIR